MNPVAIVVDSTVDLTKDDYIKHDIHVIPLLVIEGETVYHDGVDIDIKKLYSMVKESKHLPRTSAESPGVFLECYKKLIDSGYDIVFVGIGEKLSATVTSSKLAANELAPDRIFTINSNNLSSASGILALKCCKLRDEGKSAKEIYETVQALAPLLVAQFAVETLDYLYKGGRCNGITALVGKVFHIHPIILVDNGKLIVYNKPRGKMQKAIDEQIKLLKRDLPNVDMDYIMATSGGCDKEISDYMISELSKIVKKESIHFTETGCVIGSHCGYGTIGLLYLKTK
jgi:DegV family protein with EDD domain